MGAPGTWFLVQVVHFIHRDEGKQSAGVYPRFLVESGTFLSIQIVHLVHRDAGLWVLDRMGSVELGKCLKKGLLELQDGRVKKECKTSCEEWNILVKI